jgi:hypothetical protein
MFSFISVPQKTVGKGDAILSSPSAELKHFVTFVFFARRLRNKSGRKATPWVSG